MSLEVVVEVVSRSFGRSVSSFVTIYMDKPSAVDQLTRPT